jgi:uncharacterized protein (TIGR01777 family)
VKVVVTGGTGFIGSRLVEQQLAAGHDVSVLTRDVAQAARRLPARCKPQSWNPVGPVDPVLLRRSDAVIHLAGEGVADARWTAARKQAIRASRILSTSALVRALGKLPAPERPQTFLSASAIGFYGDRGNAELDESTGAGEGFLAEACQAWEHEVFRAQDLGVRTAAVRVGIVLGKHGGALAKMLPAFRLGAGGCLGSGAQWMSWIHLDDLVALFAFLLDRPDAQGPVNGVAPKPVTNDAFTKEIGRVLGRPTLFGVPAFLLRTVVGEMAAVLLASQRVLPRMASQLGFAFRFSDLSEALADLCTDPTREFTREQWLHRPPEEVFPFFADPHNLERITPDFLRFRVSGMTTPDIRQGTVINYRLALHGLPMWWQSRIDSWQPNRSFVDVQTRGPYSLWHHTHEFEPADGGTIIRDRVRYVLPFGALGELVASGLVARDLEAIFDFRRERIQEALA